MKTLEMTNEEIVRSYREALDKKKQIDVLADLNVCRKADIIEVLKENGICPPELLREGKKKSVEIAADYVKINEMEGKKALLREAMETLCTKLEKEYESFRDEWEHISVEYLSKINAIHVMMEEDLK